MRKHPRMSLHFPLLSFLTVVLQFKFVSAIIVVMRYTPQQREALSVAFETISGRDILRLISSAALSGANAGLDFADGNGAYGRASPGAELGFALMGMIVATGGISVTLGLWTLRLLARNVFAKVRRPSFYPQERKRRERLARERRRVRGHFTTAPCPNPSELLAQYANARTGAREALRFGSMMCDLEAYCDNSLLRNENGEIVGRNSGVKGWLTENCPSLLPHYKNAMRYKGLAEKFRQAAGAADPIPAATLTKEGHADALRPLGGSKRRKITVRIRKVNGARAGKTVSGTYALEADTLAAVCKCARGILCECEAGANVRLRRGKAAKAGAAGETTRSRRGEVARLERIIEERLGGMPDKGVARSMWRIGVMAPAAEGGLATA